MAKLLIVESPAKAKTIKKYLGNDYEVVASMGHIRDLPKSKLGVDVRHSFEPQYELIQGKEKLAKELLSLARGKDMIYLATDPDREGEAISWHLAYILGLDSSQKNRVTFNEITKTGVMMGMDNPRKIDLSLVNAQQARRVLDRIVGYKLSPFISRKIRGGLSAGRVQSVAVRIVVDREGEIRSFVPEEYWTIDAKFIPKGAKKTFIAAFHGDKDGAIKITNEQEAQAILKAIDGAIYKVDAVKKGTRRKSPAPPFITSTLQQDASRKLGFQAKKTMKVAQELYEGVEVQGMGAVGLITYMRTDSLRISVDAISSITEYINNRWGKEYLPDNPRVFKSKTNSQDGHEAIRPTIPTLDPLTVKSSLTNDQYRLYKLIWERFTASQMSNCVHNTTTVDIRANEYIFRASGFIVAFNGFTVLYQESRDQEEEKAKELPFLEKGMELTAKEIIPNQHFTQPPPRYTEASLIKALEENGIGRPSTYAATISTILSREYVVKEEKSLKPTELGEVITTLMKERFPDIVNVKFTAQMEDNLDVIEEGQKEWTELIGDFYEGFNKTLKKAKEDMKDIKIHLKEDETGIPCEKCGRPMVVKVSKFGKFIACSGYPECKNIQRNGAESGSEQSEPEETDVVCEKCGRKMVIKVGKFGKFMACPGYPDCKNIRNMTGEKGVACPKCDGSVTVKRAKSGRPFYGCDKYPDCDFITNDEPIDQKCPSCGKTLIKKKGKSGKIYCITDGCGYESAEKK